MNDIVVYNDVRTEVLHRVQDMYEYNHSLLVIGDKVPGTKERLQKEQAYLKYIASTLVDLPMPD